MHPTSGADLHVLGHVRRGSLDMPMTTELVDRAAFFADLKTVWAEVRDQGNLPKLFQLQKAFLTKTAIAFTLDWSVIAIAVWLSYSQSLLWLPLSLLLIGSRQRALSNLIHD